MSNYLKGVDNGSFLKGSFSGSSKFVTASSRNQGLAVPAGTKKQMSRNTIGGASSGMSAINVGGGISEMATNKSGSGNRYY